MKVQGHFYIRQLRVRAALLRDMIPEKARHINFSFRESADSCSFSLQIECRLEKYAVSSSFKDLTKLLKIKKTSALIAEIIMSYRKYCILMAGL